MLMHKLGVQLVSALRSKELAVREKARAALAKIVVGEGIHEFVKEMADQLEKGF